MEYFHLKLTFTIEDIQIFTKENCKFYERKLCNDLIYNYLSYANFNKI